MSVLSRLTVTPLLYACGALLLLCIGLGVACKVQASKADTAEAQRKTAVAERDTARTERDAWKEKASGAVEANRVFDREFGKLQAELANQQHAAEVAADQARKAVAAAQAEAADADRTLKLFTAKFQTESRKPACARALETMGQACAALEGY